MKNKKWKRKASKNARKVTLRGIRKYDSTKYDRKTQNDYTVVSNTSLDCVTIAAEELAGLSSAKLGTLVHVIGAHCISGELAADIELSDRIESFELEARLRIESSEELDLKCSFFSRSSSLKRATNKTFVTAKQAWRIRLTSS